MKRIKVCTVFDINYATYGLAMMESLESKTDLEVAWYVLALDTETKNLLAGLQKANLCILEETSITSFNLSELKSTRDYVSYCWSLASIILDYLAFISASDEILIYVDADIYFYSDIKKSIQILNFSDIAIHEHRFSKNLQESISRSGRFNVGVIAGKNNSNFRNCIRNWRDQVAEECTLDPEKGKCGDQHYLNDWPINFPRVGIMKSKGDGAAVWNISSCNLARIDEKYYLDDDELIFFHFHGFKILLMSKYFSMFTPSLGYGIGKKHFGLYREYLKYICDILIAYPTLKVPITKIKLRHLIKYFLRGEIGFTRS